MIHEKGVVNSLTDKLLDFPTEWKNNLSPSGNKKHPSDLYMFIIILLHGSPSLIGSEWV